MLKIGDFSQLGQVSVRTLRLYDEMGLLKPAHVDRFTDYRYYSLDQLPRLNRILALKDLGFSLEQIARLLKEDVPPERLRGMLTMRQAELEQQVEDAQARLARVEARLRQIEREGGLPRYDVIVKEVEAQTVVSLRRIVPTMNEMVSIRCAAFASLYRRLEQNRVEPGTPELAIYHNAEYTEENIDMEAAVVVEPDAAASIASPAPLIIRELPAASVASVVHHGRFMDVCDAIVAAYAWMAANGGSAGGPYREIHLFGRENDWHDMNAVTLEVQLPLAS
jgi:DNA-binding transcriptional MerR regulator